MNGVDDYEFGDGDEDLSPDAEARIDATMATVLGAWPAIPTLTSTEAQRVWAKLLASARQSGPVPFPETQWPEYIDAVAEHLPPVHEVMAQLQRFAERAEILLRCQRRERDQQPANGTR